MVKLMSYAVPTQTTHALRLVGGRWPLAKLDRSEWLGVTMTALVGAGLFALFHFLGNTVYEAGGRSALLWMVARWKDPISFGGADYSHGFLIPLVSLWALWTKRQELMSAPKRWTPAALWLIAGALLLHWVGAKLQQTRMSLMALIVLLWAIPYYFYGWAFARHLLFPVGYLIFCIPMNFLDVIAFPLRLFATAWSVRILRAVGVDVIQTGTAIRAMTPFGAERWGVDVANPCSGLRSLLALTALTAVYAYATQRRWWKQWLLFAMSIPLAIAGNVARIVSIGLIAEAFGERVAVGLIHEYSGYVVFFVAIVLMVGFGALLNVDLRAWWNSLRHRWLRPTNPVLAS